jgi:hypothetical protein
MNADQLQVVVDRAQYRMEDDKKVWYLSEEDAKEFVRCVDKYIKKSVFRSDYYDPEDAYGEVLLELWRCLTKYGPRPNGKLFGEYVLPLKTNNVLTNRANKRKSLKSRVNYLTSPMDIDVIDRSSFILPFDSTLAIEAAQEMQKKIEDEKKIRSLFKKVRRETEVLSRVNLEAFVSMYVDHLFKSSPGLIQVVQSKLVKINKFENLSTSLYNKGRELCLEASMKELKIGDKLITPGGKIIEIRKKIEGGYVVYIPLIDQETEVETEYTDRCNVFDSPEEEKTFAASNPEETKQLKVYAKKIVEDEKKSIEHIEVNTSESGAATTVIVELLKMGPQTRDLLARALVNKGLTKSNDVEKAKGYVSVLISNLKKSANMNITSPKRGVYELVG